MCAKADRAREHHESVAASLKYADMHRAARDKLVRELRAADPSKWTYAALAQAVGCSPELIAKIVKRR